jgi:hypothetical protein
MKKLTILSLFALTACAQPMEISVQELGAMNGDQLCDIANGVGAYYGDVTRQTALSLASGRGMDCDPINNACYDLGLKKGTGEFANCVVQHKQLILQQQQLEETRRANSLQAERNRQDLYETQKYYDSLRRSGEHARNPEKSGEKNF